MCRGDNQIISIRCSHRALERILIKLDTVSKTALALPNASALPSKWLEHLCLRNPSGVALFY